MTAPEGILDRLLLGGGPPRSGTTLAVRVLNLHPRIYAAVDDPVHECWALYHYPSRQGLVADLRLGPLEPAQVLDRLRRHLVRDGRLLGVAPSPKTQGLAEAPRTTSVDMTLRLHDLPLAGRPAGSYLCLKSPEISFVLPQLACLLPSARFVLVFRPLGEIAESMFRKSLTVRRQAVFNRRWEGERDGQGRLQPPPGVPAAWSDLWRQGTGFQRCLLNAAAYAKALAAGCALLPQERFFAYDHARLRAGMEPIVSALASFLGVDATGFAGAAGMIRAEAPPLPDELEGQFAPLRKELELDALQDELAGLAARSLQRHGGGRPA